VDCSKNSVCTWYIRFRFVCIFQLFRNEGKIGGEGKVVEIDEACLRRRKYKKGRSKRELWVVGGIEREHNRGEKRRIFLEVVGDRSSQTLLEVIERRVEKGALIITDCWGGYNSLKNMGYTHLTVNHSKNLVDPESAACTNTIEGS
jgi:hypothetical protein